MGAVGYEAALVDDFRMVVSSYVFLFIHNITLIMLIAWDGALSTGDDVAVPV